MIEEATNILQFPDLKKCRDCSGSGLTWIIQRRSKFHQVCAACKSCRGTGRTRITHYAIATTEAAKEQ